MKRVTTILATALALALLTASVAMAGGKSNQNAEQEPIMQIFNTDSKIEGTVDLTRRSDGLTATTKATGLTPGGVYTFWWVVTPDGGTFPANSFVASGGARVGGAGGKATVRMNAELGQESIEGFLIPFNDLDFDLDRAEVHVEIAYHGQLEDADGNVQAWRTDFWTGTECPRGGPDGINADYAGVYGADPDLNVNGQPHCRVSYAAVFLGN